MLEGSEQRLQRSQKLMFGLPLSLHHCYTNGERALEVNGGERENCPIEGAHVEVLLYLPALPGQHKVTPPC